MPIVADYLVIRDSRFELGPTQPNMAFTFNVPVDLITAERMVLSFLVERLDFGFTQRLTAKVNGINVLQYDLLPRYTSPILINEIFDPTNANIVNGSQSTLEFSISAAAVSTDRYRIADVILWFKKNIP
jgi:hypothetical protein